MQEVDKVRQVRFKHDTKRRVSAAVLIEGGQVVTVGFALCSVLDQFNRRMGRKHAVQDATAHLPKHKRQPYWEEYFSQYPKDKKNA